MYDLETLQKLCKTEESIKTMSKEQAYYAYKYVEQDLIEINDKCFSILTSLMCCYY